MSAEHGKQIVGLARSTLDSFVRTGKYRAVVQREAYLSEKRGLFVTLNLSSGHQERLRGCIGFPYAVKSLGQGVQEATVAAASEDPRFPPVRKEELDAILVEVSILTVPELLVVGRRRDIASKVKVGEDGLIISTSFTSGLLLPQVAVEHSMDAEEFLSQACLKAGLTPDAWLDNSTSVQTFRADIFAERTPRGKVDRVDLE